MCLTLVAVPLVVLIENFWLLELIEAVINRHVLLLVILVHIESFDCWSLSLDA